MASIGEELTNVPIGEMVGSMGLGIAQAQYDFGCSGYLHCPAHILL
jgi:hypothetical protein